MALELPDWLTDAFNLIGLPWPGIDEDQLRAWATSVRQFATDISDNSSQTNQTMRELADSSQSSVITAVAQQYESHHRLLTELHGPIDDFAAALDYAADAVVAQKWIVIGAATALAAEFTATQIGAIFTLGADEAALPEELISTQQIVKFALKELEAVVIGRLINWGAQVLSDHVNRSIMTLANDAWAVKMEADGLKIAYGNIRRTASKIRGHADDAEDLGNKAQTENTSRDLEDSSGGSGWSEVINALKQGLLDVAGDLFKSLPGTIARVLRDIAAALENLLSKIMGADRALTADTPKGAPITIPLAEETPRSEPTPSGTDGGKPSPEQDCGILDEKLKDAVKERYKEIVVDDGPAHQSSKKRGPVLTGAMDRLTGEIEFGQNGGGLPEPLHPSLAERINNRPAEALYPGGSGVHSEIHALNRLLWKRETAGRPTIIDDNFSFYSVRLRGIAKGDPIVRCDSCAHLTDGAEDLARPRK
jgi:hypothetical protein